MQKTALPIFILIVIAISTICIAGCIFSGCCSDSTNQASLSEKVYYINGTVSDIRYFPVGYYSQEIYQIMFQDGTFLIVYMDEHNPGTDPYNGFLLKPGINVAKLKIGKSYSVAIFQKMVTDIQPI